MQISEDPAATVGFWGWVILLVGWNVLFRADTVK